MDKQLTEKSWLRLNAHGKNCLYNYVCAISANDMLTTQMDYLNKKGLIDYRTRFKDYEKRIPVGIECLTDLGIETVKHYFPKIKFAYASNQPQKAS